MVMTDLIDAATIADLTDLDESAMNETFTITNVTQVSDGAGSTTETTTTSTVQGYMWSLSGDEAGEDQVKATGKHRIALPKTTTVTAMDRIAQQSTGKVYQVKYPFPVTSYSTSLILGVEDV